MKSYLNIVIFSTVLMFAFSMTMLRAQAQGTEKSKLIRITGTVIEDLSNEPVEASVFYEKLPYYDDMVIAKTNELTGAYELSMLENNTYIIHVKADGYEPISEEIEITDSGTGIIEKNFKVKLDSEHERFSLDDLIFARSKAIITTSSYAGLDRFVEWLNKRPEISVQLEGHTDFQGNAEANMILSQERVDAVKKYLTKKGIKKSRISTKAYGGTQPLSRERTPEARTSNRRVEVVILQQ